MRVVFDTNVIVSGLNFPGNERLALELGLRGRFQLVLSPFILEELAGVLRRKLGWAEDRAAAAIRAVEKAALVIDPPRLADVIEGSHADNRILECAAAASADYLVTGDRRHLLPIGTYLGASIVNAPRFLSALAQVP